MFNSKFILTVLFLWFSTLRAIQWNGNKAFGCDFINSDLANVQIKRTDCEGICFSVPLCTHFSWNNSNGGTCWMKYGNVSKSDARDTSDGNVFCGVIIKSKNTPMKEIPSNTSIIYDVIVVPVVFGLIVFAVIIAIWIRKKKQILIQNGESKSLPIINSRNGTTDKWEICPNSIVFDKKIGQGAFGNVFLAKISSNIFTKDICSNQTGTLLCESRNDSFVNVAVKLLKDDASQSEINDFVEEINLMKGFAYHKNVLNIIGCCTIRKPLCLLVEFMENGDLLNFLRYRRTKKTETILVGIETLTPNDLISFAWQVASGMEYLSDIKLVHGDLAARNVLVGADKNVKISDFGLTRKVNDELNYMSSNHRRLPVKWMSIEAIFNQMFTSYSDVWAFGVVLFEIVTLGGTPYPAISNCELLVLLKNGYRMDRPDNCSQIMFDHILHCWNEDPLQRPSFTELRNLFEEILSRGGQYISFEVDEKSEYYKNASFHSFPSNTNEDALENELLKRIVISVKEMNKKERKYF